MEPGEKVNKQRYDLLGPRVVKALENRRFEAYYCATKEEGAKKVLELIPPDHEVSWGGSITMEELDLVSKLKEAGYKLLDRKATPDPKERQERARQALLCDSYIMSTNGLSSDGVLVNIDGVGNRLAALIYGPSSVIIVTGLNKVSPTVEDAYTRAQQYAAPTNVQRVEAENTICGKTGQCGYCKTPGCICSQIVFTRMCKPAGRIKVVLIGDDLGY